MRIKISTRVEADYRKVFAKFDQHLFLKLNPPLMPVKLLRFDGMNVNDEVHLELNFPGKKQLWVSRITEYAAGSEEIYFVDEGIQLPFFLKSWRHFHRIIRQGNHSAIVDDIFFECKWAFLDYLIYPFLYLQFLYRKPVYRRFFNLPH